jgi:hypothetical protein
MQTPDISPLVKGALAIIGLALALGQYGRLEHWARTQALHAVAWREPLPSFFAPPGASGHRAPRAAPSARPHRHAGG